MCNKILKVRNSCVWGEIYMWMKGGKDLLNPLYLTFRKTNRYLCSDWTLIFKKNIFSWILSLENPPLLLQSTIYTISSHLIVYLFSRLPTDWMVRQIHIHNTGNNFIFTSQKHTKNQEQKKLLYINLWM